MICEPNKPDENGNGRDANGRFAPGCAGGPGRPRRAVESEYMRALSDAVSLATWRQIVARAVDDALAGDNAARAWLAKYLLGSERPTLLQIAVDDEIGFDADEAVHAAVGARLDAETEPL